LEEPVTKASTYTTEKDEDKQYALSGIRNHNLRVQAMKAYASDRAASGTGDYLYRYYNRTGNSGKMVWLVLVMYRILRHCFQGVKIMTVY
jgi:hypothetical protein